MGLWMMEQEFFQFVLMAMRSLSENLNSVSLHFKKFILMTTERSVLETDARGGCLVGRI